MDTCICLCVRVCVCVCVCVSWRGIVTFNATPNPFLLNEICLNQCKGNSSMGNGQVEVGVWKNLEPSKHD